MLAADLSGTSRGMNGSKQEVACLAIEEVLAITPHPVSIGCMNTKRETDNWRTDPPHEAIRGQAGGRNR